MIGSGKDSSMGSTGSLLPVLARADKPPVAPGLYRYSMIGRRVTNVWLKDGSRRRLQTVPAFTMIELLVTIAIISMLVAILLPSLRKARVQTKRAACMSNLKSLGSAWHMYLNEYDGSFLKGINAKWNYGGKQGDGGRAFGLDPNNPNHRVPKLLNPQLGLDEVVLEAEEFRCPADKGGGDVPTTHYDYKGTSYVTNPMLIGQDKLYVRLFDPCRSVMTEVNKGIRRLRRHQLHNEGKLILMGDGGWLSSWDLANPYRIEWHDESRGHNVVFMDGHAKFLRIRKGLHVTSQYNVIPFKGLQELATECQVEKEDE